MRKFDVVMFVDPCMGLKIEVMPIRTGQVV